MKNISMYVDFKESKAVWFTTKKWIDLNDKFINQDLSIPIEDYENLMKWSLEDMQQYFSWKFSWIVADEMAAETNISIVRDPLRNTLNMARNWSHEIAKNDPNYPFECFHLLVSQRVMRVLDSNSVYENRSIFNDMMINPNGYHPALENKEDYLKN